MNFKFPGLGLLSLVLYVGCSWRGQSHTKLDGPTPFARVLEICFKANTGEKGGANVAQCNTVIATLTPHGRFQLFKKCAEYMTNQKNTVIKEAFNIDCPKLANVPVVKVKSQQEK